MGWASTVQEEVKATEVPYLETKTQPYAENRDRKLRKDIDRL